MSEQADNLLLRLDVLVKQVTELHDDTLGQFRNFSVPPPQSVPNYESLDAIRTLIQSLAELEVHQSQANDLRERALSVLERVLSLKHSQHENFHQLQHCQIEVEDVRRRILAATPEGLRADRDANDLAAGTHPLIALIVLVEEWDQLEDVALEQYQRSVQDALGPRLALAAAGGALTFAIAERTSSIGEAPVIHANLSHTDQRSSTEQPVPVVPEHGTSLDVDNASEPPEQEVVVHQPEARETSIDEASVDVLEGRESESAFNRSDPSEGSTRVTQVERTSHDQIVAQTVRSETPSLARYNPAPRQRFVSAQDIVAVETLISESEALLLEHGDLGQCVELPVFSPDDTTRAMVKNLGQRPVDEQPDAIRNLIWRLIELGNVGLAHHLAIDLERQHPNLQPPLPVALVRVLALGRYVISEGEAIAGQIREDLAALTSPGPDTDDEVERDALALTIVAATLRPALFAPNTGALNLLGQVDLTDQLPTMRSLRDAIIAFQPERHALDPEAILAVHSEIAWSRKLADLQQRTGAWSAHAYRRKTSYVPAIDVWHTWFGSEDLILSLLRPLLADDPDQLDWALAQVDRLSDVKQVQIEIGKAAANPKGESPQIVGAAFGWLSDGLKEAIGFLQEWCELRATAPPSSAVFLKQKFVALSDEIAKHSAATLEELERVAREHPFQSMRGAVASCERAVKDLLEILAPDGELPTRAPDLRHILHGNLLLIPAIALDETTWRPMANPDETSAAVLELLTQNRVDWREAFKRRCTRCDHVATGQIIAYLTANPVPSVDIEDMVLDRQSSLVRCRQAWQRTVATTRRAALAATTLGHLASEEDAEKYQNEIDYLEVSIPNAVNFEAQTELLASIRAKLVEQEQAAVQSARIWTSTIEPSHPAQELIEEALSRGDVRAAEGLRFLPTSELPTQGEHTPSERFEDFFVQKFGGIENHLKNKFSHQQLISDLKRYARGNLGNVAIGPINLRETEDRRRSTRGKSDKQISDLSRRGEMVRGAQADVAAEMLSAYYSAKHADVPKQAELRQILTGLGFVDPHVDAREVIGGHMWFNVATTWSPLNTPSESRSICPIPAYGSQAEGRYRVLCVQDRPTEDHLLQDVGEIWRGDPVIVLHFGRVTSRVRRDLARACREKLRTVVVLDEVLLLYLCGERGSRLPVFFDCALPFTYAEAYKPTSSLVPAELFYGRDRERRNIIDPDGPCFIYGGRQVGKTALLHDVERVFHDPKNGQIACFIEVKGLGLHHPLDELWTQINTYLVEKHLGLPAGVGRPSDDAIGNRVLAHIQAWLDVDPRRRILLLLDETDYFLAGDGNERFPRVDLLKRLMTDTRRRFKVVFAGLHNVQRTTRLSNQPLAHLSSICIGPLLYDGEARAARQLVEQPLASLGYRFQPPELVERVLQQTNYYPNLIQTYCYRLLNHLTGPALSSFDPDKSPPYNITSEHLEDTYQMVSLAAEFQSKFRLTLDLDARYRVIAYLLALNTRQRSAKAMIEGFPVLEIWKEAVTYWRTDFEV